MFRDYTYLKNINAFDSNMDNDPFNPDGFTGKLGLISDSHSMNSLMLETIDYLKNAGVDQIIHLGDICDSMYAEELDEGVEILDRFNIKSVRGNNECYLLTEMQYNRQYNLKKHTIEYIESLPYQFCVNGLWFTHSLPFDWPAATRYPIKEYISMFANEKNPSYRIMFRGHSHIASVVEMKDGNFHNIKVESNIKINLNKDCRYIISIGAIEEGNCAIYDPVEDSFISVYID